MNRKRESGGSAGGRRVVRCPQKTGINMNMYEDRNRQAKTLVVGIVGIVVAAGLAAKFGVIDQYRRLNRAEAAYAQVHGQNAEVQAELADYDKVVAEYRTYSMDWMAGTAAEDTRYVTVNREDVLDLVDSRMRTRGTVTSVTVKGSTAVVNMAGMSLNEISEMFDAMEDAPIVKAVELDQAATEKDREASVMSFSVIITLQGVTAE